VSRQDLYFSLIHERASFPNQWVERFYRILDEAVHRRAAPLAGLRQGSLYFPTEMEARRAQLGDRPSVRVLVPLYTREFLHTPPPDFGEHLSRRTETDLPFVHPVLWDAYVPARSVIGLAQAMSLGDAVREYRDCGMASICRLNAYADELTQIVDLLADRVVHAAEHPDQTPEWIVGGAVPLSAAEPEARFLISVIRSSRQVGDWAPFGARPGSVTERAMLAAHRLILLPEVAYPSAAASLNGVREAAGVLLLDAAALNDAAVSPTVERLLPQLPPWMTVVLIFGDEESGRQPQADALADTVRALAQLDVRIARNAPEYERVIDDAVFRARRNYLRGHPNGRR
jgi:hypothetical protein